MTTSTRLPPHGGPEVGAVSDRNHACERLAALDVAAAAGDLDSAREARWHEQHPAGARTPEEAVQEAALGRSA